MRLYESHPRSVSNSIARALSSRSHPFIIEFEKCLKSNGYEPVDESEVSFVRVLYKSRWELMRLGSIRSSALIIVWPGLDSSTLNYNVRVPSFGTVVSATTWLKRSLFLFKPSLHLGKQQPKLFHDRLIFVEECGAQTTRRNCHWPSPKSAVHVTWLAGDSVVQRLTAVRA